MRPEEAFGKILKNARNNRGFSLEQLALGCGLDKTFISMLEQGQRQPSLISISSISAALNVPVSELIRRTMDLVSEDNKKHP